MTIDRRSMLLGLAGAPVLAGAVQAQAFPSRPIRFVVGFGAGGTADLVARLLSRHLGDRLGQPVIVDNRPGASGTVGALNVIASPPDGYAIYNTTVGNVVHSSKPNPPFSITRDLVPVIMNFDFPLVFYVGADMPVRSMRELVEYIRTRPGRLNYSSVGVGSGNHLAFELLKQMTGLTIEHIPYRSTAESVRSVMTGDAQVGLDVYSALRGQVEAGALRVLAVSTADRSPTLPNLPGMRETGLEGIDVSSWLGVTAPAATPRDIIARLNREMNEILRLPDVVAFAAQNGFVTMGGTPEQYGERIARDVATWSEVIRRGAIEIQ